MPRAPAWPSVEPPGRLRPSARRRSALLQLSDAVPELGGFLIRLARDRLLQLLAELDQLALGLLGLRQPAGRFPGVPRLALSYLRDPALPAGAKIVVFAGSPKMGEVLAGGGHRWYRRIGDVHWLHEAWGG